MCKKKEVCSHSQPRWIDGHLGAFEGTQLSPNQYSHSIRQWHRGSLLTPRLYELLNDREVKVCLASMGKSIYVHLIILAATVPNVAHQSEWSALDWSY